MTQALLFGLIASSALVLGGALGVTWRAPIRLTGVLLAFASGSLISALAFELFPEAVELGGLAAAGGGLLLGALLFVVVNAWLDRRVAGYGAETEDQREVLKDAARAEGEMFEDQERRPADPAAHRADSTPSTPREGTPPAPGDGTAPDHGGGTAPDHGRGTAPVPGGGPAPIPSGGPAPRAAQDAKPRYSIEPEARPAVGLALLAAVTLDGVPENLALGFSLTHEASLTLLVAVFASNLPEALVGSNAMRRAGRSKRFVIGVWTIAAILLATAVVVGRTLLSGVSDAFMAWPLAVAGGAVIASLADTLMPEAFEHGQPLNALATAVGFFVSFALAAG